jgi:hypothetical protein
MKITLHRTKQRCRPAVPYVWTFQPKLKLERPVDDWSETLREWQGF